MERRSFLSLLGLGVASVALDQAIPLGRVWSFPSKLFVPREPLVNSIDWPPLRNTLLTTRLVSQECLEILTKSLIFVPIPLRETRRIELL